MPKRKKASSTRTSTPLRPAVITVTHYEVTSEPIIDGPYKCLPEHVKDSLERLYALAQIRPRQAIPELEKLLHMYPNVPTIYNYLSVAYSLAGEGEKAEHLIAENYRLHPEYLFARLNQAQICLQKNDYAAIPAIFEHKFDLQLLYPKRKRFHISEAAGFMGVIGQYFYATGERALAENAYEILRELAPKHVYTRRLKRLLYPNFFQRLLQRLRS
jgi:tetratricopeptide (TPR) repeat protein